MHRLTLAINLFRIQGEKNFLQIHQLINGFGVEEDDILADWVASDLFKAWLDRQRGLIEDRRFSDSLVRLLGLPTGMVITQDHLDPHYFPELLEFFAA